MEIFLLWLFFAFLVAFWASSMRRSFAGFLFLSIILSPIIGAIALMATGASGKTCPFCIKKIDEKASICPNCQKNQEISEEKHTPPPAG